MSPASSNLLPARQWAELRPEHRDIAELYIREHGDGDVVIARAPGRVNLMGRHVDHQGGHVNMMAIDRSVRVVAGLRADRLVRMANVNSMVFGGREFSMDEILPPLDSWHAILESAEIKERGASARGDWSQYAKAALARIQFEHRDRKFAGLNLAVAGDVPRAAGLSSSSAVLVAIIEAAFALYGLYLPPERFAEFAGEAEWYVGTRGGAGDHAAMKLAEPGHVVQIGFYPMAKTDSAPFPNGCSLLVCDSGEKAAKSAGAKDLFNQRVACYHLGRDLIKLQRPDLAERLQHLRDINPDRLQMPPSQILTLACALPFRATRSELSARLPQTLIEPLFSTHSEPVDGYPIRETVLFGLAECERSRAFSGILHSGSLEEIGRAMKVSHDGDRVERYGNAFAFEYLIEGIDELMRTAAHEGFQIADVPGRYACSTPGIDRMVDIALSVQGTVGAQIAGAGLGGCMMALVRLESMTALKKALVEGYYEPTGQEPSMLECLPSTGSGLMSS